MPPTACGGLHSPSIRTAGLSSWYVATNPAAAEKQFYRQLIAKADKRFDTHVARIKKEKGKPKREK